MNNDKIVPVFHEAPRHEDIWGNRGTAQRILEASRPGCSIPRERAPRTHLIGGWVDPRAGLNAVGKRNPFHSPGGIPTAFICPYPCHCSDIATPNPICNAKHTQLHLVPRSKNEWSYTSTPIRLHGVVLS